MTASSPESRPRPPASSQSSGEWGGVGLPPASAAGFRVLSGLVHELRTPLGSILMLSEMLAEPGEADADRRQAQKIHRAAQDIRALLDQVALLARIEDGQLRPEVEEVLLTDFLAALEEQLGELPAAPSVECSADAPRVVATDPRLLGEAVRCLLPQQAAGERIRVRFGPSPGRSGGGGLRICILRPSSPVERSQLDLLFEPFHPAVRASARRHGGQSLDLTLARALVRFLGGSISATVGGDGGLEISVDLS
ncbi:MAG: HAMP domain-containing histidine kinase [Holophagales bacterium]|nr:HAMP domain-containing histidine kinase [Holophagales bacterium]